MHPAENLQKDGFINNNDCNNGNWGILRSESGDVLSPIYDNGASFSPNVPEKRIINKLHNLDSLEKGIYDSVTAYSLNGESNTTFVDIIHFNNESLKKSAPAIELKDKEQKLIQDTVMGINSP